MLPLIQQHRRIMAAIDVGDAAEAEAAMRHHHRDSARSAEDRGEPSRSVRVGRPGHLAKTLRATTHHDAARISSKKVLTRSRKRSAWPDRSLAELSTEVRPVGLGGGEADAGDIGRYLLRTASGFLDAADDVGDPYFLTARRCRDGPRDRVDLDDRTADLVDRRDRSWVAVWMASIRWMIAPPLPAV